MAIIRRVNQLSQMREEIPDLRAIESAASGDFDLVAQSFISGTGNPYIINGFAINFAANPIGSAASNLQVIVANGSLLHTTASQSGTFFLVPAGTAPVTLNAATVSNVSGAFVPSSNNYVGIDYYRFQDPTTDTQRYLWDPSSSEEDQAIAPAAIIMNYEFVITPTVWASNILPIAIVTTDSGNNVISITDSRPLLFRLGTGGTNPNPFFSYNWTEGTTENPVTSTSNGSNPFFGGDKGITDLKDWIDAVESGFLAAFGGPYWYSFGNVPIPNGSLPQLREDVANTILTGNGNISHGVIPDTNPTLSTTGNVSIGNNQITGLASTVGLANGQYISGEAFAAGTTVLSFSGTTVTASIPASDTVTGTNVYFTNPVATQPGQINWSNTLNLKIIGSNLDYQIAANPTGSTVTLTDGQVAYLQLTRDSAVTAANLIWTNGSPTVTSVGGITWTTGLEQGDWVKLSSASHAGYYQIMTVNSTSTVTLTANYTGTSTGATGAPSQFAYGEYTLPGVSGNSRDIQITSRGSVPIGPNFFWLFSRNDDGGVLPRVYVKWLGLDLTYGVSENISGPQIENVLEYIGSPVESATQPLYVSAYSVYENGPTSVLPQISTITTTAASAITASEYFIANSAANSRSYLVWFKISGSGTKPTVADTNATIEVDILSSDTNAQVATKLAAALNNELSFKDFTATSASNLITVTNNSSGTSSGIVNGNTPFTFNTTQVGTGVGNYAINDGDNLTLAVKKLDFELANLSASLDSPNYDETVEIVASGAVPPTSLTGPISAGTNITIPNNSREGNIPQFYTVGSGSLLLFLNGQFLDVESGAYTEVGTSGAPSATIQIQIGLVVGDELEIRLGGGGGGGGGEIGPEGPQGPAGAAGPAGADAANGPVNISQKTSSYTVLSTDGFLLANTAAGAITFTLPTAASSNSKIKYFKKTSADTNSMIIQGAGSDQLDSAGFVSTNVQYEAFSLISDGTQWWLF